MTLTTRSTPAPTRSMAELTATHLQQYTTTILPQVRRELACHVRKLDMHQNITPNAASAYYEWFRTIPQPEQRFHWRLARGNPASCTSANGPAHLPELQILASGNFPGPEYFKSTSPDSHGLPPRISTMHGLAALLRRPSRSSEVAFYIL